MTKDAWGTAYFRRINHNNGNTAVELDEQGRFPEFVTWENETYRLDGTHYPRPTDENQIAEGYYEYYG